MGSIIVLWIVSICVMATTYFVVKQITETTTKNLDKFIGTISFLSWMWTEPEDKEEELVPMDDVNENELLKALKEDLKSSADEYEDN